MLHLSLPSNAPKPHEIQRRTDLSHHVFALDDGHKVGVSIGGRGVPLVFLHGLALNRRAYLEMLSEVAGLGFLVVAIDVAGHGDTDEFGSRKTQLAEFAALTLRTLDFLGVEKAVFVGHSLGGRIAIDLAASAPERVLATVLLNAAAGASFDRMLAAVGGPPSQAVGAIMAMLRGTGQDLTRVDITRASGLARTLTNALIDNLRRPLGPAKAALAAMQSPYSTAQLRQMRDHGIPTMVLHGDMDFMVPFQSARDMAAEAGASLWQLYGACHSWMLANPQHGVGALRRLVAGELGNALGCAAEKLGIPDWRETAAWERALIAPQALIRQLDGQQRSETDDSTWQGAASALQQAV
jgi:pimeloyl-ACP methyl ester carboxylesterase